MHVLKKSIQYFKIRYFLVCNLCISVFEKDTVVTKMQVQFENLSLSNKLVFLISEHDECITNQHNCDENALCFNTVGGHNCVCKPGYTGNGTTCKGNGFQCGHLFH